MTAEPRTETVDISAALASYTRTVTEIGLDRTTLAMAYLQAGAMILLANYPGDVALLEALTKLAREIPDIRRYMASQPTARVQ